MAHSWTVRQLFYLSRDLNSTTLGGKIDTKAREGRYNAWEAALRYSEATWKQISDFEVGKSARMRTNRVLSAV